MDEDQVKIPLPEDFDSFYKRRLDELIEDYPFSEMCGKVNPYTMETIYNYRDYEVCLHARLLKELYDAGGDGRIIERYWKEQCAWLRMRLEQKERENSLLQKQVEEPPVRAVREVAEPVYAQVPQKKNKGISFVKYGAVACIAACVAGGVSFANSDAQIESMQDNLSFVQSELAEANDHVEELENQLLEITLDNQETTDHEVSETESRLSETIVYVTPSGKKYHKDGCSYLTPATQRGMTISQAKEAGYTACSRCHPGQ